MKKRMFAWLLVVCLLAGMMPMAVSATGTECEHDWAATTCTTPKTCTLCGETEGEALGHTFDGNAALCEDQYCTVCESTVAGSAEHASLTNHDGQEPTYLAAGWEPYVTCESCGYSTFTAIPVLEPYIDNYEDFIYYLGELENLAQQFARENPGKDPVALVIKYIRTGVERYNSGSWGIMAGYEDADFANYVRKVESEANSGATDESNLYQVTALKNIEEFCLPNGDRVDFGHMFGTMDISYHNNGSQAHADVAGWAGDLVDLMTSADRAYGKFEESTVHLTLPADYDLETMVEQIGTYIFLHSTCPDDKFTQTDFYGDMDGMYIINQLNEIEYQAGDMKNILSNYFTTDLSDEDRAAYFMNTRLGNSGTRAQVRAAVYEEYSSNRTVTTLESTREWMNNDSTYLAQLRKAACYALADYVCMLAGDYVNAGENLYYTDFSSEISQLAPGITQEIRKATSADGKQMVYYLATADLSNSYVTVNANYYDDEPTEWAMARVLDQANTAQAKYGDPESEDYIENYQIVAAINSDGFNMSTGAPGGLLVMHGTEYHAPNSNGFFGITLDGEAVIGTTEEYNTIYKGKLRDAVGAFGTTLVKDGKVNITASSDYYNDRASRTAVGITKTGKVVFMVLDGRQEPVSCGGSMIEIAQIMLEAGCVEAINLDGGGSTTFVSKPEGSDELQVTNSPSDGYARSVSSTLIMVSTAPSSTAFDHAIIESDYSYATTGTSVQLTATGVSATGNVAEMPEGYTWAVSDERVATVTADGVFAGARNGSVDVYVMLGDEIIGTKTMTMVIPDSVYFTRKSMNAVYGSSINLPIAALYEGKAVAIGEADVTMAVSPEAAGTCEGFRFIAAESEVKSAQITATLALNTTASGSITINLYKQGENSFDFEKADGGDQQMAWSREVSNSVFDGVMTYTAVDKSEDMVTSYIFAMDMTQLTMPEQLSELVYMLPGADDPDASAWNFMLQLAERISVLTNVTATVQVDERFDVDISELKIINEYFEVTSISHNEETNEISITLNWKDQTMAIDAATANPLCIINGIKITPKEGTFANTDLITVISTGKISYEVYLRTSTLYSFCLKPENQEKYGLKPFTNTFIDANGEEKEEAGGYFVNDNYKTFNDYFQLSYAMLQGWVKESGGWAYYVDDVRLTGVQLVDGYYYNFGEEGLNVGQAKFTGIFSDESGMHYVRVGEIVTSGWTKEGNVGYHCHADGCIYVATIKDPTTCTSGGWITYTCQDCGTAERVGSYVFPEGHAWDNNYVCRSCEHVGQNIVNATTKLLINGKAREEKTSFYYQKGGVRPGAYVTFDGGTTLLDYSNDNNVNDDHTMKDLYIAWVNDKGIGKAVLKIEGRGDYYGYVELAYYILPYNATNLTATVVGADSVLLEWTAGAGAKSYRIAVDEKENIVADVTGTSYVLTDLTPGIHTFYVMAHASSDNADENGKDYSAPDNKIYPAPSVTATTVAKLEAAEIDGDEITVRFSGTPVVDGTWKIFVVSYDEGGKMLGMKAAEVTGLTQVVALEGASAAHSVGVYVLDANGSPILLGKTITNQ